MAAVSEGKRQVLGLQITPIGWLLIPMGIISAIVAPRRLYRVTIFFAPFSATAVLNVGAGDTASGVQVYVFFAVLLILRTVLDAVVHLEISIPKVIRRPLAYLFVFVFVCAVSVVMPFWIDGRLQIMSPILLDMTTTPLRLSSANITGIIYLLLGACSMGIVARKTIDPEEFRASVRVYTLSGAFISAWGLFQAACHILHIPYPSFIFNSSATPTAQGFDSILESSGLQRISSVAVEPSLFAACLLTIIPFSLVAFVGGGHVVSRRADKWLFGLMLAALFISTSSTAYLGLAVLLLLCVRYLMKFRGLQPKYVLLILAGLFSVVVAYLFVPAVQLLFQSALLSKSGGYSALERTKTIVYAYGYFLQYPILGVGWSSVTSHDTIVMLLSNCGIAGLLAFSIFIGSIFVPLRQRVNCLNIKSRIMAFDSPALLLLIILITTMMVAIVDGFPHVFGHFWVVLGLAVSAPVLGSGREYLFREANRR